MEKEFLKFSVIITWLGTNYSQFLCNGILKLLTILFYFPTNFEMDIELCEMDIELREMSLKLREIHFQLHKVNMELREVKICTANRNPLNHCSS